MAFIIVIVNRYIHNDYILKFEHITIKYLVCSMQLIIFEIFSVRYVTKVTLCHISHI